jgi:ferredoxin
MNAFKITIDGREVEVQPGASVLDAARQLGVDIPTLCHLEKCGPLNTCLVCLVKVVVNGQGRLVPSCGTKAVPGMVIESETEEVHEARRTALELLFSDHVGDCLSPCHRLCPLQLNIPAVLRHVEAGRLDEAIGGVRETLPLAAVLGRLCNHPCEQGCRRGNWDSPAAIRDLEKFLTDQIPANPDRNLPSRRPSTHRRVVVVGAGPTGLAAAFQLAKYGHYVTVVDRRPHAGGSLRDVKETELPSKVLDAEISLLASLGIEFRTGIELGVQVTIEGLLRGFEVILLTVGELAKGDAEKLGLPLAGAALRTDPNTCQTPRPQIFAAGGAVKPVKQLVRAMAEGRAAAECVHRFLTHQPVRRPEKPFSSVMGRMDPGEVRQMLRIADPSQRVTPCDRCAGLNRREAATEASRCLHCDCRSSGDCVLQHYAQVYGADANRFKSERRQFEQQLQPAGLIFEPGKCILCGICVRLAELARESLGLTFIGRGFDVRIAAPFQHEVAEGLRLVADECVKHCPTGALVFSDKTPAASSIPCSNGAEAVEHKTQA